MSERDASESGFEIKLENEGRLARRNTSRLPGGLYFFEDELKINGILATTVITCSGWLLELFSLTSGKLSFFNGEMEIQPAANKFGVIYPPFTLTKPCFKDVTASLKGIAGTIKLPGRLTKYPAVFETDFIDSPPNFEQVVGILDSGQNLQTIEAYPKASLLSLKAKRLIDENYLIYPSIARIAARLKVSHEHLTRQFKRDFAMTPNTYLHQLRIADANFRLSQGEKIITVSNEVGYNDLSRFYKQFRKSNAKSPGDCQNQLKSQNNIKKRQDF